MNKTLIAAALLGTIGLAGSGQAAEQRGVTLQATPLREAANTSARTLLELPAKTRVAILKRQGGWYQVQTIAGQQGWLTLLSVRFDKAASAQSSNLAHLLQSSTQVAPAGGVATGVRGISEEQLASGASTAAELQALDRYAVSSGDARAFARDGELVSQSIDYAP